MQPLEDFEALVLRAKRLSDRELKDFLDSLPKEARLLVVDQMESETNPGSTDNSTTSELNGLSTIYQTEETKSASVASFFERTSSQDPAFLHDGRFRIDERLGEGGMGVVYKAWDRERGRHVGLKTLPNIDADRLHRFKQEFRGLSDFKHPNIISLHELFSEVDMWYFTMEVVDGVNLRSWFDVQSNSETKRIFHEVAQGLAAIHGRGFLHRDLKPSNILVRKNGTPVIIDLGLLLAFDEDLHELTQKTFGDAAGTLAYMAPEQLDGNASYASDWYSFGVVLFECLYGILPFTGGIHALLKNKWRGLGNQQLAPVDGCQDLVTLVAQLLQPRAEDRPSPDQILRTLEQTESSFKSHPSGKSRSSPVGREKEIESLVKFILPGELPLRRVAWLSGDSGIGKSVVLNETLARINQAPKTLVLRSRCYEQESVPFKALDGIIDELGRFLKTLPSHRLSSDLSGRIGPLVAVFPTLGRVRSVAACAANYKVSCNQTELRRNASLALGGILESLTDQLHIVFAIDDLQWGDSDSLRMLWELLERIPRRFSVAIASRSNPLSPCLHIEQFRDRLRRSNILSLDLQLSELDKDKARELARALLTTEASPREIESYVAESKGHPFFLTELVSSGDEDCPSLDGLLSRKIVCFSESARFLLQLVCISPHPYPVSEFSNLTGTTLDEIEMLCSSKLLSIETSSRIARPYHDRVRETVCDALSATQASLVHEKLIELHSAHEMCKPAHMAFHLSKLNRNGEASLYYEDAGRRARETMAFGESADLFQKAIDVLSGADSASGDSRREKSDRLAKLYEEIGDSLALQGELVQAAKHYQCAAAKVSDPDWGFRLEHKSAEKLLYAGEMQRGTSALASLLKQVGQSVPATPAAAVFGILKERTKGALPRFSKRSPSKDARILAVCRSASQALSLSDPLLGFYFQTLGCRVAGRNADWVSRFRVWGAPYLATSGRKKDVERARRILDSEAERIGVADEYEAAIALFVKSTIDFLATNFSAGTRSSEAAMKMFHGIGASAWWQAELCRFFSLCCAVNSAATKKIRQLHDDAHDSNSYRESCTYLTMMCGEHEVHVRLADDNPESAWELSMRIERLAEGRRFDNVVLNYHLRQFWLLRYVGRETDCLCLAKQMGKRFRRSWLAKHLWARGSYHFHRGAAAVAAASKHTGADWHEIQADALAQIKLLRGLGSKYYSAIADLLESGLVVSNDRARAASLLNRCLAKFRVLELPDLETICLDRLTRLREQVPSGSCKRVERQILEGKIRNPDAYFALYSPGNWPAR